MSNLLALDQSSKISGWAYFKDGKLIEHGIINAKQKDFGERLHYIRNQVKDLIDKFNIDEVILEDIQLQDNVGNNVQTFKALAEVFGVIYELVTELKIKNDSVLSVVWKSRLSIKGKDRPEQKANAKAYVVKTYSINPTQDEADAICIGSYILNKSNEISEEEGFFFG